MEDLSNKIYGDWTVLTFVGTNKNLLFDFYKKLLYNICIR